jgi:uncharacterized membrane protein
VPLVGVVISIAGLVAALSSTLFAGAALYITLVEHPARMECGVELASTVFGPSYRRAARMQASLALVATIAGLVAWASSGGQLWLAGAALILSVVPFTLLVVKPTNEQLLDVRLDRRAAGTRELLERWGRLHLVRTIVSSVAALVFLWQLAR